MDFKDPDSPPEVQRTAPEMVEYCKGWLSKHPFVSIEDPFDQDDWDAGKMFMDAVDSQTQIVRGFVSGVQDNEEALDVLIGVAALAFLQGWRVQHGLQGSR